MKYLLLVTVGLALAACAVCSSMDLAQSVKLVNNARLAVDVTYE